MSTRREILARVRAAQLAARLPAVDALEPHAAIGAPRPSARHDAGMVAAPYDPQALVTRFVTEAQALGGECWIESTSEAVRARVATLVAGQTLLAWDAAQLPYGIGELTAAAATARSPRTVQAAATLGVTGSDAALAETGSLVMIEGAGRPRLASLLPPVHLAILRRDDLFPSMAAFFAARAPAIAAASSCTVITGPSRTADIELTLTLGIHGPGRVLVIVGP